MPGTLYAMVGNLVGQVLIGLLIGLIVSLLFAAVRVGGDVIDYQMGFTQAATFNPQFNETVSPIANFQYHYALVLYLIANGHWLLLASLERSFVKLPVGQLMLSGVTLGAFTDLTFQMLVAGLQIAAPGAAVLLITDIAFAFLNRALPQMQVFYLGMPVKILVGLSVVIAVLPSLTYVVGQITGHPRSHAPERTIVPHHGPAARGCTGDQGAPSRTPMADGEEKHFRRRRKSAPRRASTGRWRARRSSARPLRAAGDHAACCTSPCRAWPGSR